MYKYQSYESMVDEIKAFPCPMVYDCLPDDELHLVHEQVGRVCEAIAKDLEDNREDLDDKMPCIESEELEDALRGFGVPYLEDLDEAVADRYCRGELTQDELYSLRGV